MTFCFMISISVYSLASDNTQAAGWHWYNEKNRVTSGKKKHIEKFKKLPPLIQLKILKHETEELKAKAILSGDVTDIANYKRAQDMWVEMATRFSVGWQRMLVENPDLDYSFKHPSQNNLVPIMLNIQKEKENDVVKKISKTHALILFYKGSDKTDNILCKNVRSFSNAYKFSYLEVSEDGFKAEGSGPRTRIDLNGEKARFLGINHFPALVLTDLKKKKSAVIGYGYFSQEEIPQRIYKVVTGWSPTF